MSTYAKRIKTGTAIKFTETIKSGIKFKIRNELKDLSDCSQDGPRCAGRDDGCLDHARKE